MSKWLLRGLVFAALMVFVRLVQGALINAWETKARIDQRRRCVVLFAIVVFVWGFSTAAPTPAPTPTRTAATTWR